MEVLGQIQARHVSVMTFVVANITIWGCYIIAGSLGHVKWWLPMISDCAVQAPEKYFFRFGMILSATLIGINSILMFGYLNGIKPVTRKYDHFSMWVSIVAAIGLGIVGSVNEEENNPIHSGGAVVFFVGYLIYMILTSIRFFRSNDEGWSRLNTRTVYIKSFLAIICFIDLTFFTIFSQHWGKWHIQIAFCEWLAVMFIVLFNMTNLGIFGSTLKSATLLESSSDKYLPVSQDDVDDVDDIESSVGQHVLMKSYRAPSTSSNPSYAAPRVVDRS